MYIQRHIDESIKKAAAMFGAVLVTGARQVGKTTLLENSVPDILHISLDDPVKLQSAVSEGGTFLKDNPPPVCIDEIQYAPNLFPHIKMIIDKEKKRGLFFLSGSQAAQYTFRRQFHMIKNASESLAGRIGILNLLPLSLREISKVNERRPFLPDDSFLSARKKTAPNIGYNDIWQLIQQGLMPQLKANPDDDWKMFYGAYVKTYIERDVRYLTQVGDEIKFMQFMTVLAASIGQLLNMASVAREIGISIPTVERWLSILTASNIVYLLRPYHNNIAKRTVKTPKLYFIDTGLAAYLTRWHNPEVLKNGAMAGAFFENFVIMEIVKSYANSGVLDLPFYFYRDKEMREIDLVIEDSGTLYPIEIKKTADPRKEDVSAFGVLDKIPHKQRGSGGVVCMYDSIVTLKGNDKIIPAWIL
jgi:predicted AAA+ superfamily ATPase